MPSAVSYRFFVLLLLFSLPSFAASSTHLVVRYYDQTETKADPQVLMQALQVAESIFERAGIGIEWVDACAGRTAENPVCGAADASGIRIVFVSDAIRTDRWSSVVAAFASRQGNGSNGFINVFYDRAIAQATTVLELVGGADRRRCEAMVLGHVIAHEIGHELLPNFEHSNSGIMVKRFGRSQWMIAASGSLYFSDQQASAMRARVNGMGG